MASLKAQIHDKGFHPNPNPHAVILGFIPRIHPVAIENQVSVLDGHRYWFLGTSLRMTGSVYVNARVLMKRADMQSG